VSNQLLLLPLVQVERLVADNRQTAASVDEMTLVKSVAAAVSDVVSQRLYSSQQQQLPSMMVSCCVCVCQSYGKK